jgi:hypothetical protein
MKKRMSIKYRVDRNTLNQRYEDLRSEVIAASSGTSIGSQGFALFVHQGMIGWIEAWSKCETQPLTDINNKDASMRSNLPLGLRDQMTMLLTNMVISIVQGD